MDVVVKKISELIPNSRNIRRHNRNQIQELVKSVNQFGVIRPIIVDEKNVILCGHGLFEALKENGNETADCVVVTGLTEKQKKKLMLADNKIYDLAVNDYEMIDSILKEFGQEGDFSIPGYSAETLEDLYGIKSVEKEVQESPMLRGLDMPAPMIDEGAGYGGGYNGGGDSGNDGGEVEEKAPVPSARVQEERAKAFQRNVIICPHCGGTIEV